MLSRIQKRLIAGSRPATDIGLAIGNRVIVTRKDSRYYGHMGSIEAKWDVAPSILIGLEPHACDVWGIRMDRPDDATAPSNLSPIYETLAGLRFACEKELGVLGG